MAQCSPLKYAPANRLRCALPRAFFDVRLTVELYQARLWILQFRCSLFLHLQLHHGDTNTFTAAARPLETRDVPSRVRVLGRVIRHYSDSAEFEY